MQSRRLVVALKLCALLALVGGLVAGTGPRPEPAEGAFPGENGRIVFVSDRDGDLDIYSMEPDGTDQVNLTSDFPETDRAPTWSADGRIAFESKVT